MATKRAKGKATPKKRAPSKPKKKPAPPTKKKPAPKKRRPPAPPSREREQKELARKRSAEGLRERLMQALELAQLMAEEIGITSSLRVTAPPMPKAGDPDSVDQQGNARDARKQFAWKAPWAVVARFTWRTQIGYAQLYAILNRWSQRRLEVKVNKDRLSRIRVNYETDRGKREEYTMAETGPWALMLARAKEQCDPSDTETSYPGGRTGSLASRYPESTIESTTVWLSDSVSKNFLSQ
jgi:hypothetical protein